VIATPDFDVYSSEPSLDAARVDERWVEVGWDDGERSRFHHVWLRDNCACAQCVHEITREQTYELVSAPPDAVSSAAVDDEGALDVRWVSGHRSRFHPGWLRVHRYDRADPDQHGDQALWDGSTPGVPPTFDGPDVLGDDDALLEWLVALRRFGLTRLRDVPCDHDAVGRVAGRIGIVRETNFGVLWDVRSEPDPVTNANTSLALPPHVDLATREYQPGLQFLHCIQNDTTGGEGRYLDGFRVAAVLRDEHPDAFQSLTTVPWSWANRSKLSDYRWSSPMIVLDRRGSVSEVRVGNWLRAPLAAEFDQVESAYAAYRTLFELSYRDDLAVQLELRPGDVLAFDNRRVLHGRAAFGGGGGTRFLRGCYLDRDELHSRLRVLDRQRRAAVMS